MNYANRPGIKHIIKRALKEDIGRLDITTAAAIRENIKAKAVIIAKEKGTVCGIDIVKSVFKTLDPRVSFKPLVKDGDTVVKGSTLAEIHGFASGILSAERVALNFLGFLSGISTRTAEFVSRIKPYKAKILDTRKTLPGLRELEKYAVRTGGGFNHRFCLDEMVLIKENHLEIAGLRNISEVVRRVRKKVGKNIMIEVEVRDLREFKDALVLSPDVIMLDNMSAFTVRKAVKLRNAFSPNGPAVRPKLETSGNITFKNISSYAATGVDFISLGTLTKDIESLDVSLEFR